MSDDKPVYLLVRVPDLATLSLVRKTLHRNLDLSVDFADTPLRPDRERDYVGVPVSATYRMVDEYMTKSFAAAKRLVGLRRAARPGREEN